MMQERTPRRPDGCLLPTLLERLRDDDPTRRTEPAADRMINRARMREIVRDALVDLFNTTSLEHDIPPRHTDALASVLNYGIPPLAGGYLSEIRWQEVERMIRRAILRFEPRIIPATLRIEPPKSESDHHTANTLRFTIHAMIHMDPHPVEFSLMSDMDLETHCVEAVLLKS